MYRSTDKYLLSLVCCIVLLISISAQAQFEGVIETDNITTDEMGEKVNFVMTLWIKDNMLKIQSVYQGEKPATTMIYRSDRGVIWMVNEQDKTYFEIRQDEEPQKIQGREGVAREDRFTIKRTGKKRKILGYSCEQVILKRREEQTEIWGTKSLSGLSNALAKTVGEDVYETTDSWTGELRKMQIFPLVATTTLNKIVVESQEVKKVDSRRLPDEIFQLPAGYTKQQVDALFGPVDRQK